MAYSLSASSQSWRVNGKKHVRISISELDVQTDSEGEISYEEDGIEIPTVGTIVRYSAAGSVNIAPQLGRSAEWTDGDTAEIMPSPSAAASINETTHRHYVLSTPGTMYLRTSPASNGSAVASEILIVEGWDV